MFDPNLNRVVVYGGVNDDEIYGLPDAWALTLGANPTWTEEPSSFVVWGQSAVTAIG